MIRRLATAGATWTVGREFALRRVYIALNRRCRLQPKNWFVQQAKMANGEANLRSAALLRLDLGVAVA